MKFSPMWHLLDQEGCLAHSSLCAGLTFLRNANLGSKKGLFYSAFFELAIGLERTMKLLLILDHLAKNQCNGPDPEQFRRYGHKLLKLWTASQNLASEYSCEKLVELGQDANIQVLLGFLGRFADSAGRYSNINGLSSKSGQLDFDPLASWGRIAGSLFSQHASKQQKREADRIKFILDATVGDISVNLISGLDNGSLSVAQLHKQAFVFEISSRYAVLHLVKLIEGLRTVIEAVCDVAHEAERVLNLPEPLIPHMHEFFEFAWSDPSVLKKKRWP